MDRHWVRGLDRYCRLGQPERLARSQRRQASGGWPKRLASLMREVLILHILNLLFFCMGFEWFIFVPAHVSFDHLL